MNRVLFWVVLVPVALLVLMPIIAVWVAGAVLFAAPGNAIAELRELHRRLP